MTAIPIETFTDNDWLDREIIQVHNTHGYDEYGECQTDWCNEVHFIPFCKRYKAVKSIKNKYPLLSKKISLFWLDIRRGNTNLFIQKYPSLVRDVSMCEYIVKKEIFKQIQTFRLNNHYKILNSASHNYYEKCMERYKEKLANLYISMNERNYYTQSDRLCEVGEFALNDGIDEYRRYLNRDKKINENSIVNIYYHYEDNSYVDLGIPNPPPLPIYPLWLEAVPIESYTYKLYSRVSIMLRTKCRRIIRAFRNPIEQIISNHRHPIINQDCPIPIRIRSEMEDPHGEDDLVTNRAGNVVLTDINKESIGMEVPIKDMNVWTNMCTSEQKEDYSYLVDRWMLVDNYEWQDQKVNDDILSLEIPHALITKNPDIALAMPFKIYRYWKGDLEFKLQLNSNKFQIGQLQMSWYYAPSYDKYISKRDNIYTRSQTIHSLVNAGSSNSCSLVIPYKYIKPYINCKSMTGRVNVLSLGYISVKVINPMTCVSTSDNKAWCSLFVRFNNTEFVGMCAANVDALVSSEMFAFNTVSKLLNNIFPDRNRDKPINIIPSSNIIPQQMRSLCHGTGTHEQLNALRLDPRGQTPHKGLKNDEFSISFLSRVFGLVKVYEWNERNLSGHLLFSLPASPIWGRNNYTMLESGSNKYLPSYAFPPVTFLTCLFKYWRGTLELRLDFVASMFHSGRLLIAYIPGLEDERNFNIKKAKGSPHIVFDLQERQQLNFVIPFISDTPWWERELGTSIANSDLSPPGKIFVFVLNPLALMDSVPDKVYINVYLRGGDDFELSVPIQPSIGLGFVRSYKALSSEIKIKKGYYPVYVGIWHGWFDSTKLILRYGETSDHVAQLENSPLKKNKYGYLHTVNTNIQMYHVASKNFIPIFFFNIYNDGAYTYLIPQAYKDDAVKAAAYMSINFKPEPGHAQLFMNATDTILSYNKYSEGNTVFSYVDISPGFEMIDSIDCTVKSEMDERMLAIAPIDSVKNVVSTNFGLETFGENFNDLKDLCRRYQPYCLLDMTNIVPGATGKASFAIPILPQGLPLDTSVSLANIYRDGQIPLCMSGFRFYRGGIRFRLIGIGAPGILYWVQHRPDYVFKELKVESLQDDTSNKALYAHGYASYFMDSNVNSSIDIEIPYYKHYMYSFLQQPVDSNIEVNNYSLLGGLLVGWTAPETLKPYLSGITMKIFYSIADDLSVDAFQGFPPVILCDDIPNISVKSEMFSLPSSLTSPIVNNCVERVTSNVNQKMSEFTSTLKTLLPNFSDLKFNMILDCFTYLVFSIINPNVKTFCWTILSVLIKFSILTYDMAVSLLDSLVKCCEKIFCNSSSGSEPNSTEQGDVRINSEGFFENLEDKDLAAFVACSFGAACATLQTVVSPPKSFKSWISTLVEGMSKNSRLINNLFLLFRNCMSLFVKIFNYIIGKKDNNYAMYKMLESEIPCIKIWIEEAYELLYRKDKEEIARRPILQDRVYDCANYGALLISQANDCEIKNFSLIRELSNKMQELRNDLMKLGKHPNIREEPFTIWVQGDTGIGKSYNANRIVSELLKSINYKTDAELIYVRQPTDPYFNGCNRQPCLYVDDMLSVRTPTSLDVQLNLMYTVKSSSILNPPMADLKDKQLRYNPKIFYINSNFDFPRLSEVKHEQSLWRRRDVLIYMRLKEKYSKLKGKIDSIPNNIKESMDHLEFGFHNNPRDVDDKTEIIYLSWNEFIGKLKSVFIAYNEREQRNVAERLKYAYSCMNDDYMDEMIFEKTPLTTVFRNLKEDIRSTLEENSLEEWSIIKLGDSITNTVLECKQKINNTVNSCRSYLLERFSTINVVNEIGNVNGDLYIKMYDRMCEKFTNEDDRKYILQKLSQTYNLDEFKRIKDSGQMQVLNECLNKMDDPNMNYDRPIGFFQLLIFELKQYYKNKMNENNLCLHCHFKPSLHTIYDCESEEFSGEFINYIIPDKPCESIFCLWKDPLIYDQDMWLWLSHNTSIYRVYMNTKTRKGLPKLWSVYRNPNKNNLDMSAYQVCLDFIKEKISLLYEKIVSPCVRFFLDFVSNYLAPIMRIVGIIFFVHCISAGLSIGTNMLLGDSRINHVNSTINNQMIPSGDYRNGSRAMMRDIRVQVPSERMNAQCSAAVRRIQNNTVFIICRSGSVFCRVRCLMLRGTYCLVLKHYIEYFKTVENASFFINYYRDLANVEIPLGDFLNNKFVWMNGESDSNYGIVNLPQVNQFKDVLCYMASKKSHLNVGILSTLVAPLDGVYPNLVTQLKNINVLIDENDGQSSVLLHDCYMYPIHGKGLCGSVLVSQNLHDCIIGMHVGGDDNVGGVAELLCKESFAFFFDKFEQKECNKNLSRFVSDVCIPNLDDVEFAKLYLDTTVSPLGVVDKKHENIPSEMSRIRPSTIHNVFPVKTGPAPLSRKDPRLLPNSLSPMIEGCKKHGILVIPFENDIIDHATRDLEDLIINSVPPIRLNVDIVSVEDVCCGVPEIEGFESLVWDTSEGYPYTASRPKDCNNKKWLFDLELKNSVYVLKGLHPMLKDIMTLKHNQRMRGIVPFTLFVDCLKDCRLPLDKIPISGKTRIFSVCPTDFTIQFKQYYLDFIASYMKARFKAEHAIGINVLGYESSVLVNKMCEYGSKHICGDYSNFGPGLMSILATKAFQIIIAWYKKYYKGNSWYDYEKILSILALEVINANHQALNLVYQVQGGVPSGSPITTILNSLVNSLYIRCAWLRIMKGTIWEGLFFFRKKVGIVTYGDDLWMCTNDEIAELFNCQTISENFSRNYIKFTDATKKGNKKYISLKDVSFLKRSFIKHPFRPFVWLAKLDDTSVKEIANWIWLGENEIDASRVNAEMCCDSAYGGGPEYHYHICTIVKDRWRVTHPFEDPLLVRTWQELDILYLDKGVMGSVSKM